MRKLFYCFSVACVAFAVWFAYWINQKPGQPTLNYDTVSALGPFKERQLRLEAASRKLGIMEIMQSGQRSEERQSEINELKGEIAALTDILRMADVLEQVRERKNRLKSEKWEIEYERWISISKIGSLVFFGICLCLLAYAFAAVRRGKIMVGTKIIITSSCVAALMLGWSAMLSGRISPDEVVGAWIAAALFFAAVFVWVGLKVATSPIKTQMSV